MIVSKETNSNLSYNSEEYGIYFHLPFCIQICKYCDFNRYLRKDFSKDVLFDYQRSLLKELLYFLNGSQRKRVSTIYFGGGTPSLYPVNMISELIFVIRENSLLDDDAEITMEVDPKTIRLRSLESLRKSGVNRLSVGAQSFNNEILETLGRYHQCGDIFKCINDAEKAGFLNISLDLIYGVPKQSIEVVNSDLEIIKSLPLTHISLYNLTLSRGTDFFKKRDSLPFPSEDIELKLYSIIKKQLRQTGFKHYEISNFSRPGFTSKHNLNCWNLIQYKGIGAGAHSFLNGTRYANTKNIYKYISNLKTKSNSRVFTHKLSLIEKKREFVMLSLRKSRGFSREEYRKRFLSDVQIDFPDLFVIELKPFLSQSKHIRLKAKGINISNEIFLRLF